jgi:branched-chain amino acid transport system permease protein
MTRAGRSVSLLLLACGAAYGGYAIAYGSSYTLRVLSLAGIFAVASLGYQFIFGHAGALALSQGTFMGVGAYVSGILALRWGVPFDASLPFGIGAPVLLAAVIGIPVLRLQTHYFALATLVIGQIVSLVAVEWIGLTGGANGLGGVPGFSLFGVPVRNGWPTLLLVWACVAIGAVLLWQATRGRLGAAFAIMRASETAARSIGIDTARLRYVAFLLSAAYAGVAGTFYVHAIRVVSPEVLAFPVMVTLLTIAVVGGRLRIAGAIAGAVLVIELPEWFRFLRDTYLLAYGCLLLLVIVALPEGIAGTAERLLSRILPARTRSAPDSVPLAPLARRPAADVPLLAIRDVGRRFGGVVALDDVSMTVRAGEVLGLIGPNGSGKTTLVNAITGIFPARSGTISFGGVDITSALPHDIARTGIARTFQTVAVVDELSVIDNVALARGAPTIGLVQAMRAGWTDAGGARARAEAMTLLRRMGVADQAMRPCGVLPYGLRRRVEIARALATRPLLLLLDEPAAGLNETEQADLALRLRGLADEGLSLLVIEHNMPFLAPLADRMVCLDAGRVIAEGRPAEVQADARVIEAYLGRVPETAT